MSWDWASVLLTAPQFNPTISHPSFSVCLATPPTSRLLQVIPQNSVWSSRATHLRGLGCWHIPQETMMPTGSVKWFNPTKGYGFIQPQAGGKDVFVHISAVERAGLSTLNEGQIVQYEIVSNRGKESAENLKVG